ncbi:hypothetical protein RR46_06071 [Papilio xuthus]|uniref:Uncharacterized protein n=1 Tax=Papilio xuthus TaxID=66420 RepID=A0A194Q9V7_PAPXU|nr:hypothetical protein RR46_06071 [Papilio xuthus]
MPTCTHIWYQDWVCSDCCQGDRCNYYIIVIYALQAFKLVSQNPVNLLLPQGMVKKSAP